MPRSATADSVYEQEYQKLLAHERAKEKINKYKIACTVIEAKKGLDDLATKDGRPVENAVLKYGARVVIQIVKLVISDII